MLDQRFRRELFEDPVATAQRYGFRLTIDEAKTLELLAASKEDLEDDMCNLSESMSVALNCPQKPCKWVVQEPCAPAPPPGQVAAD